MIKHNRHQQIIRKTGTKCAGRLHSTLPVIQLNSIPRLHKETKRSQPARGTQPSRCVNAQKLHSRVRIARNVDKNNSDKNRIAKQIRFLTIPHTKSSSEGFSVSRTAASPCEILELAGQIVIVQFPSENWKNRKSHSTAADTFAVLSTVARTPAVDSYRRHVNVRPKNE